MHKAGAALAGISIFGLAAVAHAGAPIQLSDRQMDAVTAGSAKTLAAFQTTALGRNTAIQTSVANIATENPRRSLAQSRTAVLATGAGNASVATEIVDQSSTKGRGPGQVAIAATAGSASGDKATVQSVGVTRAVSSADRLGYTSVGIAASSAHVTTFSTSGKTR
jgi:hypothetical protein